MHHQRFEPRGKPFHRTAEARQGDTHLRAEPVEEVETPEFRKLWQGPAAIACRGKAPGASCRWQWRVWRRPPSTTQTLEWLAVIELQQDQKPRVASTMRIGIISDTHGLLRPEVAARFAGVHHIIHAGDIGRPEVISELRKIAPVTAIKGNIDRAAWAAAYPHTARVTLAGRSIYVLHNLAELDLDPAAAGIDVVVSGHSHRPKIETVGGVVYLNPGSAGPRRFSLPIALATLELSGDAIGRASMRWPRSRRATATFPERPGRLSARREKGVRTSAQERDVAGDCGRRATERTDRRSLERPLACSSMSQ